MNLIACRIHNNSLGKIVSVESEEAGKDLIRSWVADQFGRALTFDENELLNDALEFYNDKDSDNIYTFSLGIVE